MGSLFGRPRRAALQSSESVLNNMEAFTQLTVFLILIILLARAAILLSNRFGLPSISFQLLAGILIGPSLLNFLEAPIVVGTWGSISPSLLHSILKIIAEIGLIQLMFLAGLETDWSRVKADRFYRQGQR